MDSRGGTSPFSTASDLRWELQLRAKRRSIIDSLIGRDEDHPGSVASQFLNKDQITAFHRSQQPDGSYKISATDPPLISQLKALNNTIVSLEKLGPALLRPLWSYMQTEGSMASLGAWAKLAIVATAPPHLRTIMRFFNNDLSDLVYYTSELKKIIETLPHLDETLTPLLKTVQDIFDGHVRPVMSYVEKVKSGTVADPSTAQLQLCTAASMLGNVLQTKVPQPSQPGSEASDTFRTIMDSIREAKYAAEKIIKDKYHLKKDKKKGAYSTKDLKSLNLHENEKRKAKNIVHVANVLIGMETSLERLNLLLVGGVFQAKNIMDVFNQLSNIVEEFNKISLDEIKISGLEVLEIALKRSIFGMHNTLIELVRYVEMVEGRFGLKDQILLDNLAALYKQYEMVADKVGIKIGKRYPYCGTRLAVRQHESTMKEREVEEIRNIKNKILSLQEKVSKDGKLADIKELREEIKKVSSPQTYYYEIALDQMIIKGGKENLLTPALQGDMLNLLIAREERALNGWEQSQVRLDQAIKQVEAEYKTKETRDETWLEKFQPEHLYKMPLQALRRLRNEVKARCGDRGKLLVEVVEKALNQRCGIKPDIKLDVTKEEEAEAMSKSISFLESFIREYKDFEGLNIARDNQLKLYEVILNRKKVAVLKDDTVDLDIAIKQPQPYQGEMLEHFSKAKREAMQVIRDQKVKTLLAEIGELPIPSAEVPAPAAPSLSPPAAPRSVAPSLSPSAATRSVPPSLSPQPQPDAMLAAGDMLYQKCVELLHVVNRSDIAQLRQAENGFYPISFSDSLIAKNMKSMLNAFARLAQLNQLAQYEISRISGTQSLMGTIATYAELALIQLPSMKALIRLFQQELAEASYYMQNLFHTLPNLPLMSTRDLNALSDAIGKMPGVGVLTGPTGLWPLVNGYLDQAKKTAATLNQLSLTSGLTTLQQIDYGRHVGMILGGLDSITQSATVNNYRSQFVAKIQLIKTPTEIIQQKIESETGIKPRKNGKYDIDKREIASQLSPRSRCSVSDIKHLMHLSNSFSELESLCKGLGKMAEGDFLSGLIKVIGTLSSIYDQYKALDAIIRKEISPSMNKALLEVVTLLRPLLLQSVASMQIAEHRLGVDWDTLLSNFTPFSELFEQLAEYVGDKSSDKVAYLDAQRDALLKEKVLLESERNKMLELKKMIDALPPDRFAQAPLRTLIQMRDRAALFPPSASFSFVRDLNKIIFARMGLDKMENNLASLQERFAHKQEGVAQVEFKMIAAKQRLAECTGNQNRLTHLLKKYNDVSPSRQPITIEELRFLHALSPVEPSKFEDFVTLFYSDPLAGLDCLKNKMTVLKKAGANEEYELLVLQGDLKEAIRGRDLALEIVHDCEEEIQLLQKSIVDPQANLEWFEEGTVPKQGKPDCTALFQGMLTYSKQLDQQSMDIDKRLARLRILKTTAESPALQASAVRAAGLFSHQTPTVPPASSRAPTISPASPGPTPSVAPTISTPSPTLATPKTPTISSPKTPPDQTPAGSTDPKSSSKR